MSVIVSFGYLTAANRLGISHAIYDKDAQNVDAVVVMIMSHHFGRRATAQRSCDCLDRPPLHPADRSID